MKTRRSLKNTFVTQLNSRKLFLLFSDTCIAIFSCIAVTAIMPNSIMTFSDVNICHYWLMVGILTVTRFMMKTYNSVWRFADSREYLYLIVADVLGCVLCMAIARLILHERIPVIYIATTFMASLLLVLCSRLAYRQLREHRRRLRYTNQDDKNQKRIGIIGAGYAGTMLVEEMLANRGMLYKPFCFFDNNKTKVGHFIHGVRVRPMDEIEQVVRAYDIKELIVAIPSLPPARKQDIISRGIDAGCRVKIYEYPFERLGKDYKSATEEEIKRPVIRDINIEDLLPRDTVSFNMEKVQSLIRERVVMVTGGGGSIGSELCRQVASMKPRRLVILDIYENNAFEIQQELFGIYGDKLDVVVEITSIRDAVKIDKLFAKHRPDIVYHAAAHKHVPLMEDNCDEAIKNNVFGTYNLVQSAEKYGVRKFIMISTDKAVNPTNVMGATKRLCEMIIQSKSRSKTDFVAVRFGNVLGSNGSVIPMFAKQIAAGGPVTLTDKRITRYFMTIPEAVQLVMQTGAMAAKSEIFVLDMGKPVKIMELAENMIRLSGLTPHIDIDIIEIGLRPGEKLYEELLMQKEGLKSTEIEKIFIDRERGPSEEEMASKITLLRRALDSDNMDDIRSVLKRMVPTFRDPSQVNCQVEESEALEAAQSAQITYLDDVRAAT